MRLFMDRLFLYWARLRPVDRIFIYVALFLGGFALLSLFMLMTL